MESASVIVTVLTRVQQRKPTHRHFRIISGGDRPCRASVTLRLISDDDIAFIVATALI
jgi:hypothetical protein